MVLLTPLGSNPIISKYLGVLWLTVLRIAEIGTGESTMVCMLLPPLRTWYIPDSPGPPVRSDDQLEPDMLQR